VAGRALVSAGLIRGAQGSPEEGLILMSKRLAGAHLAGSWEFPGGKVELGEDPADTLKRELMEELGVEVEIEQIYAVGHHSYPSKDVVLLVYACRHTAGAPQALEVAEFAWLSPAEVCALELPPADEEVIARLSAELTEPVSERPHASLTSSLTAGLTASLSPSLYGERGQRSLSLELTGADETRAAGEALGALLARAHRARLHPAEGAHAPLAQLPRLIAAHGDLGAGKTTFAQGLARGLGVTSERYVNSPTFSLLMSHPCVLGQRATEEPLYFHHIDLYRLEDEDELASLGFDEVIADGVSLIEWPTRGASLLSGPHWRLELSYPSEGAASRALQLSIGGLHGADDEALLRLVEASWRGAGV